MQLLKPQQGKSMKDIEAANQELRLLELDTLIRAKRKELNQLDNVAILAIPANEKAKRQEENEWADRIKMLTRQVEILEQRKRLALVPLEEQEKNLNNREDALLKRENSLIAHEKEIGELSNHLEDKLDVLSEREQTALEYSQTLKNREFNIQLREAQSDERTTTLNNSLQGHYVDVKTHEDDMAKQKAILKGRETILSEREKVCAEKEAGFANREKAIIDRYRTLQRAINETKLKNGLHSPP